jgi:hypothetical protein
MRRLSPRWGLALLVVPFCALGIVYSVVVPLFAAPDDIWHVSFIQILTTQRALPVQTTRPRPVCARRPCGPARSLAARLVSPALLGLLMGLSLLGKLSAPALLPLVALGLAWWRQRDTRWTLLQTVLVYGVAAAAAGWWYARNWQLYGDPLGWSVWPIDINSARSANTCCAFPDPRWSA